MYKFSPHSIKILMTCDKRLYLIACELIRRFDFSVICGYRSQEAQDEAYHAGFSKVLYPFSKHNIYPSMAMDIIPYPTKFSKKLPFYYMAGAVFAIAYSLKIELRWGGDFNNDKNFYNDNWLDLAHFEINDLKGGHYESKECIASAS